MVVESILKDGEVIDQSFVSIIKASKQGILETNDDRLFICVGPTGSGKSMLGLHALENYDDNVTIDAVKGTRKDFALGIKKMKDDWSNGIKGQPLNFDEADTDNMEQNSKWNRAIFKLYMKIRFLNGFHWWNWPVLRTLDSRFVEERINGVFFCYTKEQHAPRKYAYFPKSAILRLLEKNKRLSFDVLKASIEKYALFQGYFRDYTGKLKKDYLEVKHKAGFDAVDEFTDEFTGKQQTTKHYNLSSVASMFNISLAEVKNHLDELGRQGIVDLGDTFNKGGGRRVNETILKHIENRLVPKQNKLTEATSVFLNARGDEIVQTPNN